VSRSRIGLDVGSRAVRAAELSLSSDPPELVRAAQVALPPGAVESGEISDPAAVAQGIRELWSRGGFRGKQVVMGVGNQRVIVREVTVPALPEKELRASLPFQVQEFIPLPVDEAVLDFDVIEEYEEEGRRLLRLLLVAAHREMVNRHVQAALEAKLDPVAIDLVPFALVRAIGQSDGMGLETAGVTECVVDVGADVTNLCVHEQGTPRFVRILPSAGQDVTVAVGRALGLEDEAAERAKRGVPVEEGPPPEEVQRIAAGRATAFVDELRSSLDFYLSQTPGARVGRVVVSGGGSRLPGLVDLLAARLNAEVAIGHAFQKVTPRLSMEPTELEAAEPVLAVAIGLALPPEQG